MAMASVRAIVGPPPALRSTWQRITAATGSGALNPSAKIAAGMQATWSARRGPLTMSPMWPQVGRATVKASDPRLVVNPMRAGPNPFACSNTGTKPYRTPTASPLQT